MEPKHDFLVNRNIRFQGSRDISTASVDGDWQFFSLFEKERVSEPRSTETDTSKTSMSRFRLRNAGTFPTQSSLQCLSPVARLSFITSPEGRTIQTGRPVYTYLAKITNNPLHRVTYI